MSPFTGDANILNKVLGSDSEIWKDLHGPIQSIQIIDREVSNKDQTTGFTVEIKTDESVVQGQNLEQSKICTGTYRVEALWDFMNLKSVSVKKLKLNFD